MRGVARVAVQRHVHLPVVFGDVDLVEVPGPHLDVLALHLELTRLVELRLLARQFPRLNRGGAVVKAEGVVNLHGLAEVVLRGGVRRLARALGL